MATLRCFAHEIDRILRGADTPNRARAGAAAHAHAGHEGAEAWYRDWDGPRGPQFNLSNALAITRSS